MKKASILLSLLALVAALAAVSAPQAAFATEPCEKEEGAFPVQLYATQAECEAVVEVAGIPPMMKKPTTGTAWMLTDQLENIWHVAGVSVTSAFNFLEKSSTVDGILKAEPLGIKSEILCETATVLAGSTIEEHGSGKGKVAFSTCVVNKPSGCKVKQPIEVNASEIQEGSASAPTEVYFSPTGSVFTEIVLEGCLVAGTYKVIGQQLCNEEKLGTEQVVHEVNCPATGSELEVGGLPASEEVSGIAMELESSEKWSS